MNDQLGGVLRALGPLIIGVLMGWGIDSQTSGLITTALGALVMAGWSWHTNSEASKATSLASIPGVRVEVSQRAPADLKALANDSAHPAIFPKTP
jgi:hypothetical protein